MQSVWDKLDCFPSGFLAVQFHFTWNDMLLRIIVGVVTLAMTSRGIQFKFTVCNIISVLDKLYSLLQLSFSSSERIVSWKIIYCGLSFRLWTKVWAVWLNLTWSVLQHKVCLLYLNVIRTHLEVFWSHLQMWSQTPPQIWMYPYLGRCLAGSHRETDR